MAFKKESVVLYKGFQLRAVVKDEGNGSITIDKLNPRSRGFGGKKSARIVPEKDIILYWVQPQEEVVISSVITKTEPANARISKIYIEKVGEDFFTYIDVLTRKGLTYSLTEKEAKANLEIVW